jgi:hypothetical protein
MIQDGFGNHLGRFAMGKMADVFQRRPAIPASKPFFQAL